jgi:hypothetical protein
MTQPHNAASQAVINTAIAQRQRLESGRSQVAAIVTLLALVGIGLLLALTAGTAHSSGVPTCDGQSMSQDQVCDVFDSRGGGGTFTYQQMLDRERSKDTVWQIIGWGMAGTCVLLIVPIAVRLDPSKHWGQPVDTACPRCGKRTLQEQLTEHSIIRGRTTYSYRGIVTLCTVECGYTIIRRP